MTNTKLIGVCSFGSTGSGAIVDLLKEYNNLEVKSKREFVLTYFPYGFEDLEFALMNQKAKFFSSDIAIKNFIKLTKSLCHNDKSFYWKLTDGHFNEMINNYINEIAQIQYQGRWMYDDYIFDSVNKKILYVIKKNFKPLEKYSSRKMYFSIEPEDFYKKTSELLEKIYNFNGENKAIVLDQPFPANNPLNSMKLFGDSCKAIIVKRDPRDLYLMAKEYFVEISRFLPQNDVYEFIEFYRKQYESKVNNEDILYVQYEDLVFNYEATVKKIEKFCKLEKESHIDKFKKFDPRVSLKNTKLFMKNHKYDEDIKIIEKEMTEYLYDFSKYDEIDYSENVF